MIRLKTLGTLDLQGADGAPIEALLRQPKRLALLAYLAAATPRGFHRRDQLLALFWPEADQGRARTALRKAIHVLRRALGEDALLFHGDEELATNPDTVWCDVARFDDAVSREQWAEALELYRGELLESFFVPSAPALERWLEHERSRLRHQAERVALALAAQYETDGNVTGAVSAARRAVELGIDDERMVQRLITLLDRLGDRAGAFHAFDRLARRLAAEYQANPAPETQVLIDRIRARALSHSPPADSAPATSAGLPDVPGYRVEQELGRGGMAVVYLAHDLKHGRPVAVKVFQAECRAMLGEERFLREIQITAQLAHPHILPLLDSGSANGFLYYVMPLVRGESLRTRLQREGPVEPAEAVRLVKEVAEALECAHRLGIVHRDVKPENILLQEGHAVVADFGIARAMTSSAAVGSPTAPVSSIRLAIGSRTYMSPEQASGGEVDARADIYSLGCVLYELLVGVPPGVPDGATLDVGRSEACRAYLSTIEKAMAARAADRFSSASEFVVALESPPRPRALSERARRALRLLPALLGLAVLIGGLAFTGLRMRARQPIYHANRVVVLPFVNRSGDPTLDYLRFMVPDWLSGGLLETGLEVIQPPTVHAITRNLARDEPLEALVTPRRIAQETGAGLVVSGAFYLSGDSVRFEAGLQEGKSDRLIASLPPVLGNRHDPMGALVNLRERVRAALAPYADPRRRGEAGMVQIPPSFEAYRLILQAWEAWYRDQAESLRFLSQAVALDSTYDQARLFEAVAYANLGDLAPADSIAQRLKRAPGRLSRYERLRLNWLLGELEGDHQASLRAEREMMAVAPSGFSTQIGFELLKLNRPREALETLARVDPESVEMQGNWPYWAFVAAAHHMLGEHSAELKSARRARKHYPRQLSIRRLELFGLAALGRVAEAEQQLDESLNLEGDFGHTPGSVAREVALEFRAHGDSVTAQRMLERSIAWYRALPPEQLRREARGFAEALYAAGRWEEAGMVLQGARMADGCRGSVNAVECEGLSIAIVARKGDREQALRLSEDFGEVDRRPRALEGVETYWRARIAAVLGDRDRALELLRQASVGGRMVRRSDGILLGNTVHSDVDLGGLRGYPPFAQFIRPKG